MTSAHAPTERLTWLQRIYASLPQRRETWNKLGVAGLVMLGQRMPESFFAIALPALYRDKGLPLEKFWIFGLLYLPSWIKFLWAPLLDRWTLTRLGRRRSWLLVSASSLTFSFLLFSFFAPELDNLDIVIAIMLMTGFFFATGDIAMDTYIIETFDFDEQPYGAALTRFVDVLVVFIVVSGLFWSLNFISWQAALSTGGVMVMLLGLCVLLRPEPPVPVQAQVQEAKGRSISVFVSLRQRHMRYVLPLSFLMCAVMYMLIQAPSAFLVDIGFTLNEVGYALGVPQTIAGLVGACTAAVVISGLGLRRAAWVLTGITLVGITGMGLLAVLPDPSLTVLTVVIFVWGFAAPFFVGLLITALYRWTSLSQAATDYTLMASAAFAGISLAPGLYGMIAGVLNWPAFFMISSALVILVGFSFVKTYDVVQPLVDERNRREAGTD